MAEITLDESKLKELLKIAIIEVLQEQKELFSDLLAELIKEIAVENVIKEGEKTEPQENQNFKKYDFSDLSGKLTLQDDPVEIQTRMRDAW
ncbi:hypothetical protein NDI39_18915 [Microcoleus sp. ZQ-A2]|nr:hypothetical protein [Microcoleus sp. FACHB-1]